MYSKEMKPRYDQLVLQQTVLCYTVLWMAGSVHTPAAGGGGWVQGVQAVVAARILDRRWYEQESERASARFLRAKQRGTRPSDRTAPVRDGAPRPTARLAEVGGSGRV